MIEVARILAYMRGKSAPPGRVLARIAARQHGVISRPQVLALGVSPSTVERWLRAGRLHRVHRGVYAVGHSGLTREGRWMAAVLAGGDGALLSHLSAALLWGIVDRAGLLIHVLVPGRGSRTRPGLVIHRTRHLPDEHRTERDGIPVTAPGRTLLDLAGMMSPERLRLAVEAADRKGLLDVAALVALCDASRGTRGAGELRRLALEQRGAAHCTKSPPETLFLRLCFKHGLPVPLVNGRLHGYEVDFHWSEANVVVEIDTFTFHRSWAQRQRDLRRDSDLKARGVEVVRLTPEMLDEAETFDRLAALLAVESAVAV